MRNDKERRQKRKEAGLCIQCGKDAIYKSSLCMTHYEQTTKNTKNRENNYRESGLCIRCGKTVYKGGYCEEHYLKNKERTSEWKQDNPERWDELQKSYQESRNQKIRAKRIENRERVFDHYGRSCQFCGSKNNLTIDHINNNGKEHRAELNHRIRMYCWIVQNNFPEEFQTLCRTCNFQKYVRIEREKREQCAV